MPKPTRVVDAISDEVGRGVHPDGRQERSVQTREAILRAATVEFTEYGLAGARMDRISTQANANKQGLYYHFGSKENLFKEVLIAAFDGLIPDPEKVILADQSSSERIIALSNALFDQVTTQSWVLTIITFENLQKGEHLDPVVRNKMTSRTGPFIKAMRSAIKEGQDQGIFRKELDPMWVTGQLFALVEFHFTNRYTVSITAGRDPLSPDVFAAWRKHVLHVMMATLVAPRFD